MKPLDRTTNIEQQTIQIELRELTITTSLEAIRTQRSVLNP
jgi:hypothetical protein